MIVAGHDGPLDMDRAALGLAERMQSPLLTAVMRVVTVIGSTVGVVTIMSVVGLAFLLLRRDPAPLGWLVSTATGALILYDTLKAVIGRLRPPEGLAEASGMAFPSGHASQGIAFFGMLALIALRTLRGPLRWTVAMAAIGTGLLSGLSRIYLEVHWFTDVVGGFLLGAAWLSALILLGEGTLRRKERER